MSDSNSSKMMTSWSMKRLLKDVKQIIKNPLTENGIYYIHNETDYTKGYAMIVGPADTPYFGGYYFFQFEYPEDYPFSPPKVTYLTNNGYTRFNPNLYTCGKVCVSILNTWEGEQWSACQTISSVLLALCSLLNDSPLENEPGFTKEHRDFIPYNKSIQYKNIEFAICYLLESCKTNDVNESMQIFYPIMKERFLSNYDKLLEFVKKMVQEENFSTQYVNTYRMMTRIKYSTLVGKLKQLKAGLNI
jgi:ubiquitin-conjugating enzyme E2 Z